MQREMENSDQTILPWKNYLTLTTETIICFYLATFSLAMYITHDVKQSSLIPLIVLIVLYIFVIGVCIKRLLEKLSVGALMLVIPIAPLFALGVVISLIPLLQIFAD